MYGCGTLSLELREEHRLRVFENRVLRTIFGLKDEVIGGWRKMHDEELHNLYSSKHNQNDQVKEGETAMTCSMYGGEEECI
jgi:hypothetical protein